MPLWILGRWLLLQGFQKRLQTCQPGQEKEDQLFTPKNEDIVRVPDVVKRPPTLTKLVKDTVRIVSENINRTLVSLGWLEAERSIISIRRCRETCVETGILCEGEMLRAFIMAKVPQNLI
jgi:hypothetical protein